MFSFKIFKKYSKKSILPVSACVIALGIYQTAKLRNEYKHSIKLNPPEGPRNGLEKFKRNEYLNG